MRKQRRRSAPEACQGSMYPVPRISSSTHSSSTAPSPPPPPSLPPSLHTGTHGHGKVGDDFDDGCVCWISSAGCLTPLHYDLSEGLLCQVKSSSAVGSEAKSFHNAFAPPLSTPHTPNPFPSLPLSLPSSLSLPDDRHQTYLALRLEGAFKALVALESGAGHRQL